MSEPHLKLDRYAPWRNRDFRFYEASWFAIAFSKQIETLAISIYFVSLFGTNQEKAALALGTIGLVQALPVMLLAIAGGQLADRFPRHRIMFFTATLGFCASTGILLATILGAAIPWFYALLAIGAVAQALGSPSRAALLPQILPTEQFTSAVTWNSSVFYTAVVTGPAVAGVIMAFSKPVNAVIENPVPALCVVFVCRVFALAAIALLKNEHAESSEEPVTWQSVVAGIQFVWRTKLILATITLDMFAVLLGGATYLLPIYAKDILHVGSGGLGILRSADAIGAVSMAVLLAHLPPMRKAGVALLFAVAGYGLATIIFGLSTCFWLSLLMMFMIGMLDNISVVVRHTLVQMLTPDEMRGRVSAVHGVFIVASNDLGGFESGITARYFGPVASVVAGGIGTILVVLASIKIWPQILKIGSLESIRPEAEEEELHL